MYNIESYIAPDGGGKTNVNDSAVLDGQGTTSNQNPVLFLSYMKRAIGVSALLTQAVVLHEETVKVEKGRYLRRKGDPLRQSHDNVLAWAWLSVEYDATYAEDIYNWAKWRFFVYDPNKTYSLDPRCLLQPSQVFTLALAANKKPGWLSTIWFCGGCLVSDHASGPYLLSMLASDIVRARWNLLSPLKQKLVDWAMGLLEKRREKMYRWYFEYFDDHNYPGTLAQKENDNVL